MRTLCRSYAQEFSESLSHKLLPILDPAKFNSHFSRIKVLKEVVFSSKIRKDRMGGGKVSHWKQRKPHQLEKGIAEGKSN